MKKTFMTILSLFLCLPALAVDTEDSRLQGKILCGGYKIVRDGGTTYDASKYTIEMASSTNGVISEREVFLYQNHSDYSSKIDKAYGCHVGSDILTCEVGEAKVEMDMSKPIKTSEYKNSRFLTFAAKITVPRLLWGTKTRKGTCRTSLKINP